MYWERQVALIVDAGGRDASCAISRVEGNEGGGDASCEG